MRGVQVPLAVDREFAALMEAKPPKNAAIERQLEDAPYLGIAYVYCAEAKIGGEIHPAKVAFEQEESKVAARRRDAKHAAPLLVRGIEIAITSEHHRSQKCISTCRHIEEAECLAGRAEAKDLAPTKGDIHGPIVPNGQARWRRTVDRRRQAEGARVREFLNLPV